MATEKVILAIDQGTTSTRAILFDRSGQVRAVAQEEFPQHYPKPDWVEQDAEHIWQSVRQAVLRALQQTGLPGEAIEAIGIANQRETTVVWERATGRPIYRAIVWQDRRTAEWCHRWKAEQPLLQDRTGLVVHPYFSASKIRWILEHVNGAGARAEQGELAFGTIDSFLIWRLTGGAVHATDVTNASRTLLWNLRRGMWDGEICHLLGIPESLLPEVAPSGSLFGKTRGLDFLPDGIPIAGVAGDQQASLFGQACWRRGEAKCTYGTGAFLLVHTGSQPVRSQHGLIATAAATRQGEALQYALEGSILVAGAAVQWLRDGLGLLTRSDQVEELALQARSDSTVVFVPALTGLGAPHWAPEVQGTIFGLTRATGAAELARATLEGIALQVRDLIEAIRRDFPDGLAWLRVDGGMARNDWLLQLQADVLGVPVHRVAHGESTALGAAMLAGVTTGFWQSPEALVEVVKLEREFQPAAPSERVQALVHRWERAVRTTLAHYSG
jgi:glycerol kinase